MSFFSGFGQNNNANQQQQQQQPQQQSTPFGGTFGAGNAGGTSAFGTSNAGFGGTPAQGGGGFGSTSTGFGSGAGGFGANTSNAFGAPRAFGQPTTTSGSIFGNTATTAGTTGQFPPFGNTGNNAQQQPTSSPFGGGASTNTGSSIFGGANKTAFGGSGTTGGGIFGTSGGGFGTSNNATTGAFGAPASSALGATATLQSEGTGSTPFHAFTEKETGNSQTTHYQSISFMQPYQKYSFEELRVADYLQGRRYGNGSGQAGAFGTGSTFGTFNNPGNSSAFSQASTLYGSTNTNAASPFATNTQTNNTNNNTFGTNSGSNSIFGPKPTSTGLFGTPATTTQSATGLFSTSNNNTTGGFGSGTNTAFGGPAASQSGGFNLGGAANAGTSGFGTGTGFGNSNMTSGFSGGTSSTFSTGQQQQVGGSNSFGGMGQNSNSTQNVQNQVPSLFPHLNHNNPPKPGGGLFSITPTTTATNNQLAPNQSPFVTTAQNTTGSSLFNNKLLGPLGVNNPPASGGVFGSLNNNNNNNNVAGAVQGGGGGGVFTLGNNASNQEAQGNSIFSNQQNQIRPSLFPLMGNNTNPGTGGSTLGGVGNNTNNQSTTGGLLNNLTQTQPQQTGNASTLFDPSRSGNFQSQQPPALSTSINDIDPFGSFQLFSGLNVPNPQNSGPLATPLSSAQKLRKSTILPQYRMNPSASTRLVTPQRRGGYGFSYSTYGTPGSLSSASSTPISLSASTSFGTGLGRTLGKSLSMSNLRPAREMDTDGSVLSPGTFSASGSRYSNNGSLRRLIINRGLRSDLFTSPSPSIGALPLPDRAPRPLQAGATKKKVSFDDNVEVDGERRNDQSDNGFAPVPEETYSAPSAEEQGFLRSSPRSNGTRDQTSSDGVSDTSQSRGNELAVVPEDGSPSQAGQSPPSREITSNHLDNAVGDYWMSPTIEELRKIPREKLKSLTGFKVGRHGCGHVAFLGPVDLTIVEPDKIFEHVVHIEMRSLTVYPDTSLTPEMGKGLNVPSRITLENSWPRGRNGRNHSYETSGPRYQKHLVRLKRIPGTKFESYNPETGVWVFTVEHFTTYGIDSDDDDDNDETADIQMGVSSSHSVGRSAPTSDGLLKQQKADHQESSLAQQDTSLVDAEQPTSASDLDDTSSFRSKRMVPGAFGGPIENGPDDIFTNNEIFEVHVDHFLDEPVMGSPSEGSVEEPRDWENQDTNPRQDGSAIVRDQGIAGSYPGLDRTMELQEEDLRAGDSDHDNDSWALKMEANGVHGQTPFNMDLRLDDDWTRQLQRTLSPKKQDRQALRDARVNLLQDVFDNEATPQATTTRTKGDGDFNTSIDLMHSLFGHGRNRGNAVLINEHARVQELQWPRSLKSRVSQLNNGALTQDEDDSRHCMKPSWGYNGAFIYAMPSTSALNMTGKNKSAKVHEPVVEDKVVLVSEGKDVRFARLNFGKPVTETLELQKSYTSISYVGTIPFARLSRDFEFEEFAQNVDGSSPQEVYEKLVWTLAWCLFDPLYTIWPKGVVEEEEDLVENLVRKDRLSAFWKDLVRDSAMQQVNEAESKEEEAIAYLSGHRIEDACGALIENRNFRLATLVAMIGGDTKIQGDMKEQLIEWRRLKILSEISEPLRAIYELLAGNTGVCEGCKGSLEDRARTFVISEQFNLSWKQALGLRLWYGIRQEEPIQVAIKKYLEDLNAHREDHARPMPWFVEQGVATSWDDAHVDQREDLLWGLMKVFADHMDRKKRHLLENVLIPENHQLSPIDYRLTWQLYQTLQRMQIADFQSMAVDEDDIEEPSPKIASLTMEYAWQLEGAGEWIWAVWVTLHLLDDDQRVFALKGLLERHGGAIGEGPEDVTFTKLTREYLIPSAWIWEAKALWARSVTQDHVREMHYLLHASNWHDAHETMIKTVGPQAVIEDDRLTLEYVLNGFENVAAIEQWSSGGQVYMDYLRLLQLTDPRPGSVPQTKPVPVGDTISNEGGDNPGTKDTRKRALQDDTLPAVVSRLVAALPAWTRNRNGKLEFHQLIAAQVMSERVAKVVLNLTKELGKAVSKVQVLSLPLAKDQRLRHTVRLSLEYYKAIMAGQK